MLHNLDEKFVSDPDLGPVDRFAVDPQGHTVSQEAFAKAYVKAFHKILRASHEILTGKGEGAGDLSSLAVPRTSTGGCAVTADRDELRGLYETGIRTEILRLADEKTPLADEELQLRARQLVALAKEHDRRMSELAENLSLRLPPVKQAEAAMLSARSLVENKQDVASVLRNFMSDIHAREGYVPELVIFHDFDGNLTYLAHEGSPLKPGEKTNFLLNAVDEAIGISGNFVPRLVLTEFAGSSKELQELSDHCFREVHRKNRIFPDVPELFDVLNENKIRHEVFTANHVKVPETSLQELGLSCTSVTGLSSTSFFAGKCEQLLNEVYADGKVKVIVMSDDDERSLAEHIESGRLANAKMYEDRPSYLPNVIFFASRTDHESGFRFRVAKALEDQGLPFIRNCPQSDQSPGLSGLQDFVHCYLETRCSLEGQAE